jgi:hypothetical protein
MQLRDGLTYYFDFSPSKTPLDSLASDFCFKHGAEFGVTQNTMKNGCVDPIVAYLRSQIPADPAAVDKKTTVKVGGH